MGYDWGYKQAASMLGELNGHARGGKIGPRTKAPRVRIQTVKITPPEPAMRRPMGLAGVSPPPMMPGMAKGGKAAMVKVKAHVRKYAAGGKVSAKDARKNPKPDVPKGLNVAVATNDKGYAKGGKVKMAEGGKFIQAMNMKKGALHKQLGVPQGEKIPAKKLAAAAEKGGTLGRRARLAETLKKLHKADGGKVDKSDVKQDKKMIAAAVHKHERHDHKGEPLTPLKKGGKVMKGKC